MLLFKPSNENFTASAGDPHLDTSLAAGTYHFRGALYYVVWTNNTQLGVRLALSAGSGRMSAVRIDPAGSGALSDGTVSLPSTNGVQVGRTGIGDACGIHFSGWFEVTGGSPSVNLAYRNISGALDFEIDALKGSWLEIEAV